MGIAPAMAGGADRKRDREDRHRARLRRMAERGGSSRAVVAERQAVRRRKDGHHARDRRGTDDHRSGDTGGDHRPSPPFHGGRLTGLKSYRQSAIAAVPRTGLPPTLHSWEEFEQIVRTYRQIGAIEDASELRWDIRPSAHYPTIELRICDICPKVEDAIAVASLYACLIRRAATDIESGHVPASANREVVSEGRWLAQRYGTFAFLPEGNVREAETVAELTEKLVEALSPTPGRSGAKRTLPMRSRSHTAGAARSARRTPTARRSSTEQASTRRCARWSIRCVPRLRQ